MNITNSTCPLKWYVDNKNIPQWHCIPSNTFTQMGFIDDRVVTCPICPIFIYQKVLDSTSSYTTFVVENKLCLMRRWSLSCTCRVCNIRQSCQIWPAKESHLCEGIWGNAMPLGNILVIYISLQWCNGWLKQSLQWCNGWLKQSLQSTEVIVWANHYTTEVIVWANHYTTEVIVWANHYTTEVIVWANH
jgi:hypothetical protein